MKMKDLVKQIKFGKIYEYHNTKLDHIYYIVPVEYMEKSHMIHIQHLCEDGDGYISVKGFVGAYRLVENVHTG